MEPIILDEGSIFNIDKTDLFGNEIVGEIISTHDFMREGIKVLLQVTDDKNYNAHLYEFAAILKMLTKRELLHEMERSIHNIDTFYR